MSKQAPPVPTASAVGLCPTIIQISRTPGHWKFTLHHPTTPGEESLSKQCTSRSDCSSGAVWSGTTQFAILFASFGTLLQYGIFRICTVQIFKCQFKKRIINLRSDKPSVMKQNYITYFSTPYYTLCICFKGKILHIRVILTELYCSISAYVRVDILSNSY